jgi:mRNA interferase MazF
MEGFVKGSIVVVPFPFSNLSNSKKRPALVVAVLKGNDVILCQITSKKRDDENAIQLIFGDFETSNLNIDSWIIPSKIFTLESTIIKYKVGMLKKNKITEVEEKLCEIFER